VGFPVEIEPIRGENAPKKARNTTFFEEILGVCIQISRLLSVNTCVARHQKQGKCDGEGGVGPFDLSRTFVDCACFSVHAGIVILCKVRVVVYPMFIGADDITH
jgi:hypothetical protein